MNCARASVQAQSTIKTFRNGAFKSSKEKGQALTELTLVVPLFFLLIGGISLWASQLTRVFMDRQAAESLALSDATFSEAERLAGNWNNVLSQAEAQKNILAKTFRVQSASGGHKYEERNLSLYGDGTAENATVGSECKPADARRANQRHEQTQARVSAQQVSGAPDHSEIAVTSCSDATGYDTAATGAPHLFASPQDLDKGSNASKGTESADKLAGLHSLIRTEKAAAIFLPPSNFRFENRMKMAKETYKHVSPEMGEFKSQYATSKTHYTQEAPGNSFSEGCLMNYSSDECFAQARKNTLVKRVLSAHFAPIALITPCFAKITDKNMSPLWSVYTDIESYSCLAQFAVCIQDAHVVGMVAVSILHALGAKQFDQVCAKTKKSMEAAAKAVRTAVRARAEMILLSEQCMALALDTGGDPATCGVDFSQMPTSQELASLLELKRPDLDDLKRKLTPDGIEHAKNIVRQAEKGAHDLAQGVQKALKSAGEGLKKLNPLRW